jgi:hypothetical protein
MWSFPYGKIYINNNNILRSIATFNIFPIHAMKAYRISRGIASILLNVRAMWELVISVMLGCFAPKRNPGTQKTVGWSGHFGKRKISCPCWDSSPGLSSL